MPIMADPTPEIQLFLSESIQEEDGSDGSDDPTISTFSRLGSSIWSLILSSGGGRSEARLWLHTTISAITWVDPSSKRNFFISLLKSDRLNPRLSTGLFLLMFRKRPEIAGGVLAAESHLLRGFFRADVKRVPRWFGLTRAGMELGRGGKALSQFAFVNRDLCWCELEWKGRHGQSPAMVATKPHYFLDLDILPTVSNFLRWVPEFWFSPEFSHSLRDGAILSTDPAFFSEFFAGLLQSDDSGHLWDAVSQFLYDEPFPSLCLHLLPALTEEELRGFLRMTKGCVRAAGPGYGSSSWIEAALCGTMEVPATDELLLVDAAVNHGRQLLRLLSEAEGEAEGEEVRRAVEGLVVGAKTWEERGGVGVLKRMGLLAWSLHYLMREKVHTGPEWERLFFRNGIGFRRGEGYRAVTGEGEAEKRRRRIKEEDGEEAGGGMTWRISIDGYSAEWESADLPEMVSAHCFRTWMKQVGF